MMPHSLSQKTALKNRRHEPASRNKGQKSFFISFEGPEGAGKSTQVKMLTRVLTERGRAVLTTREPGGTPLGEKLRRLLKHTLENEAPCPQTELLMMAASRAQLMRDIIKPALNNNRIVVVDRFLDSTTVYQGFGRGIDLEFIQRLHDFTVGDCRPDLTILLDLEVKTGIQRSSQRGLGLETEDRFDNENREFHQRIRQGFLALARQQPERIKIVDASPPAELVHKKITQIVEGAINLIK